MKGLLVSTLIILIAFSGLMFARGDQEKIGYDPNRDPQKDLASAIEKAQQTGQHILLKVGGEWCSWCHYLEKFFKSHPRLEEELLKRFIVVKVNYSKENKNEAFLSQFPKIEGYPHFFVLDSNGKLLHSQNTAELEEGKGYSPEKMREFIEKWGGKPLTETPEENHSPKSN